MSLATLAAPVTHEKTAKESNAENKAFAAQNNLAMVTITGNTFPIRGVLYAFGGKWSKEAKAWMVPAHRAAEAQAIADKYAPQPKAPKVAKPVVAKVAKVAKTVKAKVETTPIHNSDGNLINRADVVQRMVGRLATDVETVQGDDEVVKAALLNLRAAHVLLISAFKGLDGK